MIDIPRLKKLDAELHLTMKLLVDGTFGVSHKDADDIYELRNAVPELIKEVEAHVIAHGIIKNIVAVLRTQLKQRDDSLALAVESLQYWKAQSSKLSEENISLRQKLGEKIKWNAAGSGVQG